jgi:hypothetical protein
MQIQGVDIQKGDFKLEPKELVVLRSDTASPQRVKAVYKALRRANKNWEGLYLHLRSDERLERMPVRMLYDLFKLLRQIFEPLEAEMERRDVTPEQAMAAYEAAKKGQLEPVQNPMATGSDPVPTGE